MECPSCGASNPESATFCGLCFGPLVNPPEAGAPEPESEVEPVIAAAVSTPVAQSDSAGSAEFGPDADWAAAAAAPQVIYVGGPARVPVADYGSALLFESGVMALGNRPDSFAEDGRQVGVGSVRGFRDFYMKLIRLAERGEYPAGRQTPAFAREMLPILSALDFHETIVQLQEEGGGRVAIVRESTDEVLAYVPPTETPDSVAAYMTVYRDNVKAADAGRGGNPPQVVDFAREVLPKLYRLRADELIEYVREDSDGRVALRVRSTGEVLGYLPHIEGQVADRPQPPQV